MAEITAFRNNALNYPVYGVPYTIVLPILDADGDPVTDGTIDSLVSINGDTAGAGATPVQIPTTTGLFYLILTAAQMTADIVSGSIGSTTSGAKRTLFTLYPRKLVALASGTSQGGAVGYITLAATTVAFNNQYNGCLCVATIDTLVEARILQVCTASNQQCTVTPDWNVAPDADDTYIIYLPEGMQIPTVNIKAVSDDSTAADNLESACDNYSATRGLAGTALPAVASDGVGGLPISDAGGLDLDAILADTNELQGLIASSKIAAQVKGWDDINLTAKMKTDVNTEVADVINTDAATELAAIPTTTGNLRQMVQFLFQYFRNKRTVNATTETLFKEDAITALGTATLADDATTFTKGETN